VRVAVGNAKAGRSRTLSAAVVVVSPQAGCGVVAGIGTSRSKAATPLAPPSLFHRVVAAWLSERWIIATRLARSPEVRGRRCACAVWRTAPRICALTMLAVWNFASWLTA
jgi:hypothetical protein